MYVGPSERQIRRSYANRLLSVRCPRRRALVEKEFAHLKREHALAMLRVRGLERVQLHVDLSLLARLALALNRTREVAVVACKVAAPVGARAAAHK